MKKLFFILFIFYSTVVLAQVQQEWVRTYNSPDSTADHMIDMAIDGSGNVYVTGWNLAQAGGNNIITIKYNTSGVLLWASEYNTGSQSLDISNGLAVDSSGNCYVVGYYGYNFGPYDGVLIKYNTNGDTSWVRTLVNSADDAFTSVAVDRYNFVYVSGYSGDSAILFKYDSTGNMIWRTSYHEPQYIITTDRIRIDKFNNLYIGGTKQIFQILTSPDFLIRKYTLEGTFLWAKTYNNPYNNPDWLYDLCVDNRGNCYATGFSEIPATSSRDITTVKYDSSGQLKWSKFYDGISSAIDQGEAIICDTSGNVIYVTGFTFSSMTDRDYITIKYDENGDTLWVRTYNGPGNRQDNAYDITLDNLANVYITGESKGIGLDYDVATIKYSPNGNQEWVMRWGGPANGWDDGMKIAVDNQDNVYIGGEVGVEGPDFLDLLAIKYSQTVGISPIGNELPDKFNLSQNFSNPFNPKSNIKFQIAKSGNVKLVVYNMLGREITTLVNKKLLPGTYEVVFDGSNYPSGVYFYRLVVSGAESLTAGDYTETKKMVLIK